MGAGQARSGQPPNYSLQLFNSEVDFTFYTGGWRAHTTSGVNLSLNTWYHVAAVYNDAANNVRIYVNGVEVLSENESNSLTT